MIATIWNGPCPRVIITVFIVLATSPSLVVAMAEDATTPQPSAPPPGQVEASSPREVEAYGEADATCREWGNGCQVCRRQPADGWTCSTPGIACVPEAVTCRGR